MSEGTPRPELPDNRVRPVSRSNRFIQFTSMRCYKQAYELIIRGWSAAEVAQRVQEEWGEYTHITRENLVKVIREYRRDEIPDDEFLTRSMPPSHQKRVKAITKDFNVLEELIGLYDIQMERIGIDLRSERNINKLFPTMHKEVKQAKDILSSIAQIRMDMGLDQRHLGHLDVSSVNLHAVAEAHGDAVARVLKNPKSTSRVMGVLDKIQSLTAKEAIESAMGAGGVIDVTPDEVEDGAGTTAGTVEVPTDSGGAAGNHHGGAEGSIP